MRNDRNLIPFSPPDISEQEISEVCNALRSGWITTGPRTKELEKQVALYCGTERAVCLNSATAAEELCFRVCGIGEGDEVIVPAYTYTATAAAAIHCGAKVVFVDSQVDKPEMDYEAVKRVITDKTKAIVLVDIGGVVADYEQAYKIVNQYKERFQAKDDDTLGSRIQKAYSRILVFGDCAHSFGASSRGIMSGGIADFSSFSFHAVKNMTTAEGGAATWRKIPGVDSEEVYHNMQLLSLHGQSKDALAKTKLGAWEYDIIGTWYKCNMTDVLASIGLGQIQRYDEMLKKRCYIVSKYEEMCRRLGIQCLRHFTDYSQSSYHLFLTRIPGIDCMQRNEIIEEMARNGIATNVHYKPLPMMTAYIKLGWNIDDFPNAYNYYHNLISLPLHSMLTDEDVDYVIATFSNIVKKYLK